MRACSALAPVVALAALLLVPAVAAHGGHDGGYRQGREVGDHYVFVQTPAPVPPLLTAETDLAFQITAYNSDPFDTSNTGVEALALAWRAPDNASKAVQAERTARDVWLLEANFASRGRWHLNVTLLPQNVSIDFPVDVYGASRWMIDLTPGRGAGLVAAENLGRQKIDVWDWRQGGSPPDVKDARARLVRWDPQSGARSLHAEVPMKSDGAGKLVFEAKFGPVGVYEVFVAAPSLGLDFEDRPALVVEAISREAALAYGVEIPASSTPGPGLAFAGFAFAAVAIGLRRRSGTERVA